MPEKKDDGFRWRKDPAEEIRRAREFQTAWLDLSDCDLTEIPEEVFELTGLETLDLAHNQLKSIPDRLWDNLPNLRHVTLIHNPIENLPNRSGLSIDVQTYLRCMKQFGSNGV